MGGWHNNHQMKVPVIYLIQNIKSLSAKQDVILANYKIYMCV